MNTPGPQWETLDVDARAPKRAPSLSEQAYESLKLWIVDGDLPPAAPLSENDLARRFSMSRSPLREAIRRLQDEGLLEPSGPRGFTVPPISVDLVRDVYGVRRALETAAAQTASGIPRAEVQAMRERMPGLIAAARRGNLTPFNESDFAFHDLFIAHCGNRLLISHLNRLRGSIQRIINYAGRFQEHTEASYEEHLAILEAIESGHTDELRRTVDAHIAAVTQRLIVTLQAPQP
ncbi:GntR family transcriptional regulator [Streptomyces sp. NPDC003393]